MRTISRASSRTTSRTRLGIELGNINIETFDWAGAAGAKLVEKLFRDAYDIVAADE